MSAYDLFALHLMERETVHVDLERRRRVLEHLERRSAGRTDAAANAVSRAGWRGTGGWRRLLPGST